MSNLLKNYSQTQIDLLVGTLLGDGNLQTFTGRGISFANTPTRLGSHVSLRRGALASALNQLG